MEPEEHEPDEVEGQGMETSPPPQPSPHERMATRAIAMERRVDFAFFERSFLHRSMA